MNARLPADQATPHPAAGRHTRRRLVGLAGAAGLAIARSSRRQAAAQQSKGGAGTFLVSIAGQPASLNPNLDPSFVTQLLAPNIFNRLVALDSRLELIPDLAATWEVSDDGLTYTFGLNRQVTWHDGEPVTAHDVDYTLSQILATPAAPARPALAMIAGITGTSGGSVNSAPVVTITLDTPNPGLLTALATGGTFILPSHLYEGTDWSTNAANQAPVGSGPFQFLSLTPGTTIDLGAYHTYFGNGPYLDQVVYQIYPDAPAAEDALVNGEIDLIAGPLPPVEQFPVLAQALRIQIADQPQPELFVLGFNLDRAPLDNIAVRTALAGAIDRAALITTALGGFGEPALLFAPDFQRPPSPDETAVPRFDLAAAQAALDAAGLGPEDAGAVALTLPYPDPATDAGEADLAALATAVAAQLSALGITITATPLPPADWQAALAAGEFDLAVVRQPFGGGASGLAPLVGSGGIANYWGYADPALDAALAAAIPPASARRQAGVEVPGPVDELLAAALPIVPLVVARAAFPHSTRARGLPFGPDAGAAALDRYALVRWQPPEEDD